MFKYVKHLNYPVNIKKKDLRMAKSLITQFGGSNGELAASLRYFSQKFSMPDDRGRALVSQLLKDATVEELKEAGLENIYAEHGKGVYPTDASGVPFTVTYFAVTGDVIADLYEDMAAEQKARAVYENLIDLTDDEDVLGVLLFLRQREIVHFNRFKELKDYYKKKGY